MRVTPAARKVAALLLVAGVVATGCGTSSKGASTSPLAPSTTSLSSLSGDSPNVRCANPAPARQTVAAAQPTIDSVSFEGTATRPKVVVTGSGFGSFPAADPLICPAKAGAKYGSRCNAQSLAGNKRDGNDYGATTLGLRWDAPSGNVSAGIYVPGSYLDCIGVVIASWSATTVVFGLGCQYALYDKAMAGANYRLQLLDTLVSGTIRYQATTTTGVSG
jgi:hypothetical protein